MTVKFNIAIVGCGRISKKHFEAIEFNNKNLSLQAVCDIDEKVCLNHKNKFNVPSFSSLKDLLDCSELDLDIISLCTPSGLHAEQTMLIAKKNINIISEKPMATNWQDGLKMTEICKNNGVKLFIVKQNRLNPTLQLLYRAIKDNRFGKIRMINVNVFWNRSQSYYDQADWRGTKDLDGGALMNQASHYVDLLTWLIGPVEKIQAMMSTTRNIECEDTCIMNIKWKDGCLGSMNVTMLTYPENLEGSITVLGDTGTVKIGGVAVNKITEWKFSDKKDYDVTIDDTNYDTDSVYGFGHNKYYDNAIQALINNNEESIDGIEGLKSLEILSAAYESFQEKSRLVDLPLDRNIENE